MRTSTIDQAARALRQGEAVIFPTETVYGLGVSVRAATGPDVLYDLKERDRGKPISWLVGGADDLDRYGARVPAIARKLADAYWPGPLTLVVHASDEVPEAFRSDALDALDPELAARVGTIVPDEADGASSGVASTVLDCTQDPPAIVREGAVTLADILALA